MRLQIIKSTKKTVARVFLGVDYDQTIKSKEQFVSILTQNIKETAIGYAGFRTKQGLHRYLFNAVFDRGENNINIGKLNLDERKIINIIKKAIVLCRKALPSSPVNVFVFPTFSVFVKKKMSGTTGYTPWKNTILIFINPFCRQWKKALPKTVAHEYCHSVFLKKNNKCESLLDLMIFEGLAEHFREQTVGGERAPWTKVLNNNQSKTCFFKMESDGLLQSNNPKNYRGVFFGNAKYARWTGYTVGYHIIKSFVVNNSGLEWKRVVTMRPRDIFDKSNFK